MLFSIFIDGSASLMICRTSVVRLSMQSFVSASRFSRMSGSVFDDLMLNHHEGYAIVTPSSVSVCASGKSDLSASIIESRLFTRMLISPVDAYFFKGETSPKGPVFFREEIYHLRPWQKCHCRRTRCHGSNSGLKSPAKTAFSWRICSLINA